MSCGTMCLTCGAYIGSYPWCCQCAHPIPSDDGINPLPQPTPPEREEVL